MAKKQIFTVTVDVSGEMELKIKAKSEGEASSIAEKMVANFYVTDPTSFMHKELNDLCDMVSFDVDTNSIQGDNDENG